MAIQNDSFWLLSTSACACAAMGIAAYGLGTGTLTVPLAAGGLMALGAGLLLNQFRAYLNNGQADEDADERRHLYQRLERVEQNSRSWQSAHETLSHQLANLQSESNAGTAALASGIEDIRLSHAAIAQQIEGLINRPPPVQQVYVQAPPQPMAPIMAEPAMAAPPPVQQVPQAAVDPDDDTPFGHRLSLSLEPIVDLFTSQTAHYRLVASMLDSSGQEIAPEMFAHHVAQMGQRALLDAFIVRETLGILAQLRSRDPNLCVLVPVGAATLADRKHLQTILDYIADAPEAAAGLVLDINHGVLASLPDASLEGLAILARRGIVLSLSQASIAGVDLAALNKLNVRYVCLAASALALGSKTPVAISGFMQAARALRIQTVITQVSDPSILGDIMRSARLACGPAFAAPRRLKRTPPEADNTHFNAAA